MPEIQILKSQLIAIGRWVDSKGWCPATSGNLSARAKDGIVITVSGRAKGELTESDLMQVDVNGAPVQTQQVPSAETLLHALIYRYFVNAGFVIHTHSVYGTIFSRAIWDGGITFHNYEMQKAFAGIESHETEIKIPVFGNSQDIAALCGDIERVLAQNPPVVPAFVLAGHGIYSWGRTMDEAKRHSEAMEFLMECEYKSCLLLK